MDLIVTFAPLLGALIAGFCAARKDPKTAQIATCLLMAAALGAATWLFLSALGGAPPTSRLLFSWIAVGGLNTHFALKIDALSSVMIFVVCFVSFFVHVYSLGYMEKDRSIPRFMAYLSLFTFFMLALVTADNLLQMFFGWEGVGLCSYLLIGFWYEKRSACQAAIKAFLCNRIADVAFVLGLAGCVWLFGTLDYDGIFAALPALADAKLPFLGVNIHAPTLIGLLLFIGAMGKSAQIGLHVWLADAMEGPTPVSALIHAATMVTAGVFMVCRLSPLFEAAPFAGDVITLVGALTALMAASIALVQNDIKKVIAYSTCSQLGYMFFAAGVSAYGAAIFHLFTHAFFKALLFLAAGAVITAVHHEQDLRRMGGLWRAIPITYACMWIGSLALAGFPPFAGFYSKDLVLEAAYIAQTPIAHFAFWCGLAAAAMTAFYSWRLLFLAFHGAPAATAQEHPPHEAPMTMRLPLLALAAGALLSGWGAAEFLVGDGATAFWNDSLAGLVDIEHEAHHAPAWVARLPLVAAASGLLLAALFYLRRSQIPKRLAQSLSLLFHALTHKWYFDEVYARLLIHPTHALGRILWKYADLGGIDRYGPNAAAAIIAKAIGPMRAIQTGLIYHYALAMIAGLALLVAWLLWSL